MTYERFVDEYLDKGLLKGQESNLRAIKKLVLRARKDFAGAKTILDTGV